MQPFRVFNADIENKATKIFGGESSGLCDWGDIKYPIMLTFNEEMFGNLWGLGEIHLNSDLKIYRQVLNARERTVYNIITGYLTLLDSIADKFNFVLGYICTDPSVQQNAQLIGAMEGLHNRSYQHMTATVLNDKEKREAFNAPRQIKTLIERNQLVVEPIQEFIDMVASRILVPSMKMSEKELDSLFKALIHNLILEGIFFTGGFTYFHSLAREDKMTGSNNLINLIKEDETHHNKFYGQVIKILMLENPELNTDENMKKAVYWIREAVEKEKEWAAELFDGVYTLSIREYNDYVEYLANVICRNAGIQEIYPDNQELRSKWILKYGVKSGAIRTDFFEVDQIDYGNEVSGGNFDF